MKSIFLYQFNEGHTHFDTYSGVGQENKNKNRVAMRAYNLPSFTCDDFDKVIILEILLWWILMKRSHEA